MYNLFRRRLSREDIKMIRPTSKASLKSQLLLMTRGNVEEAEKLYDFYVKDIDELPTFDTIPPTAMKNITQNANDAFQWIKENGNDVAQMIQVIKNILSKNSVVTPIDSAPLAPINTVTNP